MVHAGSLTQAREACGDGGYFVSLAAITGETLVLAQIAAALEVSESAG
jgi:hypothetical protein